MNQLTSYPSISMGANDLIYIANMTQLDLDLRFKIIIVLLLDAPSFSSTS